MITTKDFVLIISRNKCIIIVLIVIEVIVKYVEKGNRLIVEGELNIDTHEDKDGKSQKQVKCIVNDFYFVDFKKELHT